MERIAERSEEILVLFLVLSRAGQSPAMDFLIREIEPTKLPGYTTAIEADRSFAKLEAERAKRRNTKFI